MQDAHPLTINDFFPRLSNGSTITKNSKRALVKTDAIPITFFTEVSSRGIRASKALLPVACASMESTICSMSVGQEMSRQMYVESS